MGKKGKSKSHGKGKSTNKSSSGDASQNKALPFVSVCTPTFNRRPFILEMVKNYLRQDYPHDKMEWIIIDDGTDKIGDLVKDVPGVKYYAYEQKMSLGKKRNIMHQKSSGDIIVYMDDDDYYPACRVSHAVDTLLANPKALCAGSSEIYIWFEHIKKMYQFGPYSPTHATAGTFAFKRKLLNDHKYDDDAALAEEKAFLKGYTVPFVQLDPMKVILVFSHEHNTFDKRKLLENPHPDFVRESDKTVEMFVPEADAREFYTTGILDALRGYEPGRPSMKPDVLEQIIRIEETRRKEAERMAVEMNKNASTKIAYTAPDGTQTELDNNQVVEILQKQHHEIQRLGSRMAEMDGELAEKDAIIDSLRIANSKLMKRLKAVELKVSEPVEYVEQTVAEEVIDELFG